MRVAKDMLGQQTMVAAQLRLGIQTGAGVIQVDLSAGIQAGVIAGAQFIQSVQEIFRAPGSDPIAAFDARLAEMRVHGIVSQRAITLDERRSIPNRDFILRWKTAEDAIEPSFFAHVAQGMGAQADGDHAAVKNEEADSRFPSAPEEIAGS